jgi:hypothetical protein
VTLSGTAAPAPAATAKSATGVPASDGFPKKADGSVDFKQMSPAQKLAYSRRRIQSDLAKANGNSRA